MDTSPSPPNDPSPEELSVLRERLLTVLRDPRFLDKQLISELSRLQTATLKKLLEETRRL